MKTIVHIVGNRPQFIKLAVLHKVLSTDSGIKQKIVHTGQHFSYNMSDLFFKELNIPAPEINLNIQGRSANLFIGEAADALQAYFIQQKNIVVFVYGDTNTTLAAAIAAKRTATPLLHFEAGVRTYDESMPEEINRKLTDRLSNVNYCCTAKNYSTMIGEGYGTSIKGEILQTGDLMLDAFLSINATGKKITAHPHYIVATIHRDANLNNKQSLSNIVDALNDIHADIPVVMPMHPHTRKKIDGYQLRPAFTTIPPIGYPDMKNLMGDAAYIITDSGGTSREAYFLRKKSLIIMDHPFWPEILEQGCSVSTIADSDKIRATFALLPALTPDFSTGIFGTGQAAQNIHTHLKAYLAAL